MRFNQIFTTLPHRMSFTLGLFIGISIMAAIAFGILIGKGLL